MITKQQDILWCENKAHADALVNSPVLWSAVSIMGDKNMHGLGLGMSEQLVLCSTLHGYVNSKL